MKKPEIKVSIFIPTKNPGKDFKKVLNQISIQSEKNFEVIIVDSGSTDNTLKIINNYKNKINIQLHQIKPQEFGHGKTRNLALKYSNKNSKYIVFISQDAIPANNQWLSSLLINLINPKIAGVFSRQIPKKNSKITEKFFYKENFKNKKVIRPDPNHNLFPYNIFFSNVSSAIKKELLLKFPFDETLIMSEDQQWAKNIIDAGYKTAYEPESKVIHSHDYTFKSVFQRYFDSAFSLNKIQSKNSKNFLKKGGNYILNEFKFILKNQPSFIPQLFFYNLHKILGTFLGLHEKNLPIFLKKRFSMHSYFWNKKN
jgi:rhamnosyltransferase